MTHRPVVQSSPDILGGEPVFAGTRVPVRNLIDYLEHGSSLDEFLKGLSLGDPRAGRFRARNGAGGGRP